MPTPPQRLKCHRNESYLEWIREACCEACRRPGPSEAAHVRLGNGGGTGLKPSDYRTVPLCRQCHQTQHHVGEVTFWESLDKDSDEVLLSYLTMYAFRHPDVLRAAIEGLEAAIEDGREC